MTEELNAKISLLESEVTALKQKVNEVVACLEDNELSRKVSVDYLYSDGMEDEDNKPAEEETEEEETEEAEETPGE